MKVQHIEFFDKDHFENNYYRVPPPPSLTNFIDFFWETDFDQLWQRYPDGFSDALFPNIGYTYLINLGTPYVMQLGENSFEMKNDGFLPRFTNIECHHQPGNRLFGIKFNISPVLLEKKVNFAEYKDFITPLTYLINKQVLLHIKSAGSFESRVQIASAYFTGIINKYTDSLQAVEIVKTILEDASSRNEFTTSIEEIATKHGISGRTLQRYFEMTTSISSKKALQIIRIRKAAAHLAGSPSSFHYSLYGYYDHSHFYKHLKQFLNSHNISIIEPHLEMLKKK